MKSYTAYSSNHSDVEAANIVDHESLSQYFDVAALLFPFFIFFILLVTVQTFFWFDFTAIVCAIFSIVGTGVGMFYTLRRDRLLRSPLSTLMLLGYTFSYFILPPFATILEGKGLTDNLDESLLVFLNAFVCLLVLIGMHIVYENMTFLQMIRRGISEQIYRPLGFFSVVTIDQLFVIGLFGILANVISVSAGNIYVNNETDVMGKLLQGLYPLMYVPYCILLLPLLQNTQKLRKGHFIALGWFSVALLIVSVVRNSRGVLFSGFASILITYAYGVIVQVFVKPKIYFSAVAGFLFSIFVFIGPVSDIATAMTVVRSQRTDISARDLIGATLDQYQDKEGLKRYRIGSAIHNGEWDELYVDNLFMARLSNLKFADQSVTLALSMDDSSAAYLRGLEWQRVLSIFPQTVIELFDLNANKTFVTTSSGGDLMLFATTGSKYALGGFRTGSIFGSGIALFGWFYPLVFGVLMLFTFAIVDAQTLRSIHSTKNGLYYRSMIINPLCITSMFTWMFYITSAATGIESISGLFQFIVRGWIQILFIYVFSFVLSKFLVKPFKGLLG